MKSMKANNSGWTRIQKVLLDVRAKLTYMLTMAASDIRGYLALATADTTGTSKSVRNEFRVYDNVDPCTAPGSERVIKETLQVPSDIESELTATAAFIQEGLELGPVAEAVHAAITAALNGEARTVEEALELGGDEWYK